MKTMTNSVTPHHSHPLLWLLTDVLGLKAKYIAQELDVSASVLRRYRHGHEMSAPQVQRVRDLIQAHLDEFACLQDKLKHPPEVLAYRKAAFAMIHYYLRAFEPSAHRQTPLTERIRAYVPATPTPAKQIINLMRRDHKDSTVSLRRAAKRIGVVHTYDPTTGVLHWHLPNSPAPPQLPKPTPIISKSRRTRKLQNQLLGFLASGPKDSQDVKERFSDYPVATLYRAANDLGVIREQQGFGKRKRSVWSLPR